VRAVGGAQSLTEIFVGEDVRRERLLSAATRPPGTRLEMCFAPLANLETPGA